MYGCQRGDGGGHARRRGRLLVHRPGHGRGAPARDGDRHRPDCDRRPPVGHDRLRPGRRDGRRLHRGAGLGEPPARPAAAGRDGADLRDADGLRRLRLRPPLRGRRLPGADRDRGLDAGRRRRGERHHGVPAGHVRENERPRRARRERRDDALRLVAGVGRAAAGADAVGERRGVRDAASTVGTYGFTVGAFDSGSPAATPAPPGSGSRWRPRR